MDFLRTLLQDLPRDRPSLVFDIGANEGGYTWLLRGHLPLARIEAFEPLPAMFTGLKARYADDPDVSCWQLGVSDREYEERDVAVHEAWTIDHPTRARRSRNATWGQETFDISFTTVDWHVKDLRDGPVLPRVDFLKIDTDGYEARVLAGARETLLRDRPPILIELGYLVEDLGDSIEDFMLEIGRLGYNLYDQGGNLLPCGRYQDWYPFSTTFDVAMLPAETPLRPLD